jgi:hypothetical protein
MQARNFVATAVYLCSAAMIWALHFLGIYGFTGLACARGLGVIAPAIGTLTVVALLALGAISASALRGGPQFEFERALTASLCGLAAVAIVWEAVPVFMVPACA